MRPFFLFLCTATPLLAEIPQELLETDRFSHLDQLIVVSEENLIIQKRLRNELVEYEMSERAYLDDPDNLDKLLKVARLSKNILATLNQYELLHLFDAKLLNELRMFSKFTKQKTLATE